MESQAILVCDAASLQQVKLLGNAPPYRNFAIAATYSLDSVREDKNHGLQDFLRHHQRCSLFVVVSKTLFHFVQEAILSIDRTGYSGSVFIISEIPFTYRTRLQAIKSVPIFDVFSFQSIESAEEKTIYSYSNLTQSPTILNSLSEAYNPLSCTPAGNSLGDASILQMLILSAMNIQFKAICLSHSLGEHLGINHALLSDFLAHAAARSWISKCMNQTPSSPTLKLLQNQDSISSLAGFCRDRSYKAPLTHLLLNEQMSCDSWQQPIDKISSENMHIWNVTKVPRYQADHLRPLVVGLGVMGIGIAESLHTRCDVMGFDTDEDKMHSASHFGIRPVSSLKTAMINATHVFLVVENYQQVKTIVAEHTAILRAKRRGMAIFVHTTMASRDAISLQNLISRINPGITLIEAPVSGGPRRASEGQLLILAGCLKSHLAGDNLWLLKVIASRIYYTGGVGSASILKALHQVVGFINLTSSLELTYVGHKCGFNIQFLYDCFIESKACNQYLKERLPKLITRNFVADARLAIWIKDINIAVQETRHSNVGRSVLTGLQDILSKATLNVTSPSIKSSLADIQLIRLWPDWEEYLSS